MKSFIPEKTINKILKVNKYSEGQRVKIYRGMA